jgi:non-ribosomal peptide synthetase component F
VLDGWSLPILLGELFAGYYGHWLPAAASYRRFVTWLAGRDLDAARAAWGEVLAGFDTPTVVGPPDRVRLGRRAVAAFRVPEPTTRAISELARSCHTTVSTVLQAAFAQLLMGLTRRRDVAFGAVVSGRPAEVAGADSMVGLLINTVPVRASITAATTTADLLDQLRNAHNHTLEHQHLALSEIHRVTGQERLFDTVFVYENYPTDAAALSGADGLAITELTNRDYYHYPLTIQAVPGRELDLRVQYRVDVFDAADIDALIERFQRVLVAMTTDPTQPLSSMDLLQPVTTPVSAPEYPGNGGGNRAPATLVEQILADIYAQVLRVDRVGVDESFFDLGGDSLSAMRAVAAINTALDIHLAVRTLFDAPSVRRLSQRLGGHAGSVGEVPAVSPASDL